VIRLAAMSSLAVADTCCRVGEAFTTFGATASMCNGMFGVDVTLQVALLIGLVLAAG